MFHCLALPCIALGFLAAWDYHHYRKDQEGNPDPIPHFYSIHSWLGLATMGVYTLQFVVGIFSFLLLLCCESATAGFRAALVPLHSTFGTSTFLLAIATAVAGLTEKAFFELSSNVAEDAVVVSPLARAPSLQSTVESTQETENLGFQDMETQYLGDLGQEAIFRNTIAAVLAALGLLLPCILRCDAFRQGLPREGFPNPNP